MERHIHKSTFIQLNLCYREQSGQSRIQSRKQSMLCETATKSQQQKDMDVGEVKKGLP